MASPLLLFFTLCLLHHPLSSAAHLHKPSLFESQLLSQSTASNDTEPTTIFEVTKPINLPSTKPCSQLILQHDFGFTFGSPPALANYTPPSSCPSQIFAKIVLELKATSKGTQFDRIFGVWLGGVELLRSCTAEPTANGVVWIVKKDITRYNSLLMTNQTLAVYLGNLINAKYTGVYHFNISFHFYPAEEHSNSLPNSDKLGHEYDYDADLILPISRNLPLNAGLWFEIRNTDIGSKEVNIPQNTYKAVLEVYVSPHENDEFWYTNYQNEYISKNNITGAAGNGPFREVVVTLDGKVVGAVWPFTVIYTGGFNPSLWSPISGIGSFDLPSYDIEITPLLGALLDGKAHEFAFTVTNALNVWYIDANLHIWLDKNSQKTEGRLLEMNSLPPFISSLSNFTGLNGNFSTRASRVVTSAGWVNSSLGNITTTFTQAFNYTNFMELGKDGNLEIVNQTIDFGNNVIAKMRSSPVSSIKSSKTFPFYTYSENVDHGNETYTSVLNLSLSFNEKRVKASEFGSSVSSLENLQTGQAAVLVKDNRLVSRAVSTQQKYDYDDNEFCYHRTVSSSNSTIILDKESSNCKKISGSRLNFGLHK